MRLSIVVNMYNTAKYLPKCMDSLLNQDISFDEYEIILVDDCSSDNSLTLAKKYAQQHTNIKVLCHSHNRGLAAARNTGVDLATGEYLSFVDPDDYIEKYSISELLNQMDELKLDMLKFNYQKVDEEYNIIKDTEDEMNFDYSPKIMTGRQFMYERLGVACFVWTYIYRLELIKKNNIRFIEGIYLDDTLWLPRVLQVCQRINCVPIRHHYYLQRSSSMVRITDKSVMPHKIKGQIELIKTLQIQRNEAYDSGVKRWYDKMIAHSVLSLLRFITIYNFNQCDEYICMLNKMNVFPIKIFRMKTTDMIRCCIINISPSVFCWLSHIKND